MTTVNSPHLNSDDLNELVMVGMKGSMKSTIVATEELHP